MAAASVLLTACSSAGVNRASICYKYDDNSRDNTLLRNLIPIDFGSPAKNIDFSTQQKQLREHGRAIPGRDLEDIRWQVFNPVNANGEAFWMAAMSFSPKSKYELHSWGGRRVSLEPKFTIDPLPANQKMSVAQTASQREKWSPQISLTQKQVERVLNKLRTTFPERAQDLDDRKNLQIEFVPASFSDGILLEESWVIYNPRTNREFLLVDGNAETHQDGFFLHVVQKPWSYRIP